MKQEKENNGGIVWTNHKAFERLTFAEVNKQIIGWISKNEDGWIYSLKIPNNSESELPSQAKAKRLLTKQWTGFLDLHGLVPRGGAVND